MVSNTPVQLLEEIYKLKKLLIMQQLQMIKRIVQLESVVAEFEKLLIL